MEIYMLGMVLAGTYILGSVLKEKYQRKQKDKEFEKELKRRRVLTRGCYPSIKEKDLK